LKLTDVHEAASVPPAALVRYLPALHAVQLDAPLAEYQPIEHCKVPIHTVISFTETTYTHPPKNDQYPCILTKKHFSALGKPTFEHAAASVLPAGLLRYLPALQGCSYKAEYLSIITPEAPAPPEPYPPVPPPDPVLAKPGFPF
jgi:hypothetical protein